MKLLLIKPKWFIRGGIYRFLSEVKFTPISLGILAALSEGHEVKVVDGDWDEIPYEEDFDLVGITVTTFTSSQAYEIAGKFRKKGSKVVMGGVHTSLMPDECLEHADAVVIGEAEYIWKELLKDLELGSLKNRYQSTDLLEMEDIPFPRRELLNEQPWFACVQATRGCPNTCRYCYLPSMPWNVYRKREIDSIYEELKSIKQKVVFFVDDNIFADTDYAAALFDRIAPLKKKWAVQAPTTIADNEELLKKMKRSGCFNVQMGFQTVNSRSLEWASIRQNRVEKYRDTVIKLHKYGILVTGFFIFGFDTDEKDVFGTTVEAIKKMDIDEAHLYILTPYPGTEMHAQFRKEGRLLENTSRTDFGWASAVFKPKNMTAAELEEGVQRSYVELYSHFKKRMPLKLARQLTWLIFQPRLLYRILKGSLGNTHIRDGISR